MKKILYFSLAALMMLTALSCKKNGLKRVDDVCTMIEDPYFRDYCLENFDLDGDHKISMVEAAAVLRISFMKEIPYESLSGIEYFVNLEYLYTFANHVKKMDLSKNSKLKSLTCCHNYLNSLDLTSNTKLQELTCQANPFPELDLSNCLELKSLNCTGSNKLLTVYLREGQTIENMQLPEITRIVYK